MARKSDLKAPRKTPEWLIWTCVGALVLLVTGVGLYVYEQNKGKNEREELIVQSAFPKDFFPEYEDEQAAAAAEQQGNFFSPFADEEKDQDQSKSDEQKKAEPVAQATKSDTKRSFRPVPRYNRGHSNRRVHEASVDRRGFGETRVSFDDQGFGDPRELETWPGVEKDFASYPVSMERVITVDKRFPAILREAINSELPGKVTAILEENIYGSHGRKVLLPAGTKAIGRYEPLEKVGDERIQIIWYRLITPDGINVTTQAELTDQMGRSGVTGDIDRRYFERYGMALLVSTLTAAAAYQAPRGGNQQAVVVNTYQNNLTSLSNTILQEHINIKPRLSLPAGARVMISPVTDIWFKYPEDGAAQLNVFEGERRG